LTKVNEEKLQKLDDAIKDAEKNFGESEIRVANLKKAEYYTRIGDKDKAVSQLRLTLEKTVAPGQRIDVVLMQIRLGVFFGDSALVTRDVEVAKGMIEAGGDWDRKNRLKVYEAVHYMSIREFAKAAHLFLDGIATFTALELVSYETFIYYTILSSVIALDRVNLKKKVIDSPEVLAVIDKNPTMRDLLHALYDCDYALFFQALADATDNLKTQRMLAKHCAFVCKELRVKAYSQLLESYRSVQLSKMASAFGVTEPFLDNELSRFIASGRVHCKIDKVNGIIETTRTDGKDAQYQQVLKQGDLLLAKIQKVNRVINL